MRKEMSRFGDFTIRSELRECTVDGKAGFFHCWEHYSTVIEPSPMIGGAPGGTLSYVRGIVEFPEGIRHVPVKSIQFHDEIHAALCAWDKFNKEKGENNA